MNMYTKVGIALISLFVPAGIALADNGHGIGAQLHNDVQIAVHGDRDKGEDGVQSSTTVGLHVDLDNDDDRGNATSTERSHGKQGDEERKEHATSTDNHPVWGKKGGLSGFFRWLFGLPASTTVGDIRAQIAATTTASTTGSNGNGLGFFAHLLSFFHVGKDN